MNSFFLLFTLKNWILLVLAIDVTAMAVIYKCYYNRSIVDEVSEAFVEGKTLDERTKNVQPNADHLDEEPEVPEPKHVDDTEKFENVELPPGHDASELTEAVEVPEVNEDSATPDKVASEHGSDRKE